MKRKTPRPPPPGVQSHEDALLDEELDETFPASDPIPWTHDPQTPELYLEDFTVGRRFESATFEVTAPDIKAFAARFDPQPFHLDDDAARRSVFRRLAASGWHTAAITMRLLVTSRIRIPGGMVGLGGEINWPRPTFAGDQLKVESQVLEGKRSRSKPDRGVVTMRHETKNQRGEVVQAAVIKVLVPARN
jgi:acyl dehydratase